MITGRSAHGGVATGRVFAGVSCDNKMSSAENCQAILLCDTYVAPVILADCSAIFSC